MYFASFSNFRQIAHHPPKIPPDEEGPMWGWCVACRALFTFFFVVPPKRSFRVHALSRVEASEKERQEQDINAGTSRSGKQVTKQNLLKNLIKELHFQH